MGHFSHGIATSLQTAAVKVFFEQEMEKESVVSVKIMERINTRVVDYLEEYSLVAAILFSFDFRARTLTLISGGINYFFTSVLEDGTPVAIQGMYLGIMSDVQHETVKINFAAKDKFYFVTDGITDQLVLGETLPVKNYAETVKNIKKIAVNTQRHDDCNAVCILIK